MRKWPWLMFSCVFLSLIEASVAGDGGMDLQKLQGTWIATDAVFGGKRAPNVGTSKIVVAKDQMHFLAQMDDNLESFRIELDSSKNPATIDFFKKAGKKEKGPIRGIYLLEGEKLKICFTPMYNKERPKSFSSPLGSQLELYTFSRAKRPVEKR